MHALVADAHLRNAVAAVRALGRAGVEVVALGATRAAAGRWSREALVRELGPDPAEDPGGFAEALAGAAARHGGLAVYPSQETTIDALARLEPQLPDGTVLPYPEGGVLARLREKRSLPALASEHGLRAPRTLFDGTAAALASAADGLPPDVVVKPAGAVGNLPSARAVRSHAALRELADGLPPDEPVIVQERIRGRLLSLAVVIDRDGRTADRFQEEATRTWPREAGSFAATVSMEPDEDLVERARAMLAGAGYFGLAQLDLALDRAEAVLLDVNPRFYACMPLALACGVNLPGGVARGGRRPSRRLAPRLSRRAQVQMAGGRPLRRASRGSARRPPARSTCRRRGDVGRRRPGRVGAAGRRCRHAPAPAPPSRREGGR